MPSDSTELSLNSHGEDLVCFTVFKCSAVCDRRELFATALRYTKSAAAAEDQSGRGMSGEDLGRRRVGPEAPPGQGDEAGDRTPGAEQRTRAGAASGS